MSFIVDTTKPDTTINTGPSGTITTNAASFTFSGTEMDVTFDCKLDGPGSTTGQWERCFSPLALSSLADGTYTLSVRATDTANNIDATPATRTFTVDTTAPDTTLGTVTTGASSSFAFSSEPGATFECKLDRPSGAGTFAACTSPQTYTGLTDGSYTFTVRAKDAAGNVDQTPATRSFTVDTTAPETTIDSATTGASSSFSFTSEPGATFECKLDGPSGAGTYATCTSPQTYTGLTDGAYTFSVRARDAAGNIDATPATRTFTVDTTAPQTTIDSGPTGTVSSTSAAFGFSSEAGATFECKLDRPTGAGTFAACTSPQTYTGLTDGSYTFSVQAKDAAGNVDADARDADVHGRHDGAGHDALGGHDQRWLGVVLVHERPGRDVRVQARPAVRRRHVRDLHLAADLHWPDRRVLHVLRARA